ncbi:PD-(D/E)XK nuclease-like domain-containing protein [Sandarakinorhabdus sp. DWP1-3-1]|uniref:PD-(D/E)XK nuclease-like domain-containing protein n=1 Tax=Sandarakinorhabdus sp. DWP1-3-1 TaxID=2804627 RepID=UPI003CF8DDB6
MGALITTPGAYPDIAAEDYHGAEICDAPSISASGLKLIEARSPLHYWWKSPLNPNRPKQDEKAHFAVGKAAHDLLLLGDRWPAAYFVLPEDFNARATKQQAAYHAARAEAQERGLTVLTYAQAQTVSAMAAALRANKFAAASLTNGDPEMTLAWKDAATGVWLRARPDFLPAKRLYVPDLKTAADGSPGAFARSVASFGYHQSAALYREGIEAIYGERPRHMFFIVIEKEPPHCVALYQLPEDDIHRGRMLNRRAIDTFAHCLDAGKWPGYADDVLQLPMPNWTQRTIDQAAERGELSYAA